MSENIKLTTKAHFSWIDITKPSVKDLEELSTKYQIHPLAVKDCMEPDHLPKFERLDNFDFIIVRVHTSELVQGAETTQELTNKIAVFYNDQLLVTVHRKEFPYLDELKDSYVCTDRCNSSREVVSKIIRFAIHSYEKPAMTLSRDIDKIESEIFLKTIHPTLLEDFYFLKRHASLCKMLLFQIQEVLVRHSSTPSDTGLLQDTRDLHMKLITLFDQAQEDVNNLSNIYLSLSAQKTNDVMKLLTVFSAFFMPLTFIVGIYGMNFEIMPELKMRYGYYICLLVMGLTALVIFIWFRRKKLI